MNKEETQSFDWAKSYGEHREAAISKFQSSYVNELLKRHGGNVSAAAREAKMDRKHLHDLARRLGIMPSRMRNR